MNTSGFRVSNKVYLLGISHPLHNKLLHNAQVLSDFKILKVKMSAIENKQAKFIQIEPNACLKSLKLYQFPIVNNKGTPKISSSSKTTLL